MYARRTYVTTLSVAIAALQFAAAFGTSWQSTLAYVTAAGLGGVVFYQGERAVTTGPIVVDAGVSIVVGTVLSLFFASGLVIGLLGVPWDLALWRMGLLLWDSSFGIAVAFVSAFFVVGFTVSLY